MKYDLTILEKKSKILKNYIIEYEKNGKIEEIDLYESINDILAWVELGIGLVDRNNLCEDDDKMIDAIIYANNLRKHNEQIYSFNKKTQALYPGNSVYPSNYLYPAKNGVYWRELPFSSDKRHENSNKIKYDSYNQFLKGKEILPTIDIIFNIIKNNSLK